MDAREAATQWVETWAPAWPAKDVEAISALYADAATYRALAFREPRGTASYLADTFAAEHDVECWFGEPVTAGDRAAVEWWGSWVESGNALTLAGATFLRFDGEGTLVDHRDYWNELRRRASPYAGW